MQEFGERLASLRASFEAEKDYQHDRWHKLDNDLTPLAQLPERLTREIGRLHGTVDGRLSTMAKDFERSTEVVVAKALKPATDDLARLAADVETLRGDVENLKMARQQWTGVKVFVLWLVSTLISIGAALASAGRFK